MKTENWWSWLAIVSVAVSFVLIITVWKDAKFGIIANFINLIVAFVWKVKMKMFSFISIAGRDKFVSGKGGMMIKMFSLFKFLNN